jgi:hypothetical protein
MVNKMITSENQDYSAISLDLEWGKFVASMPKATIFHHQSWLKTIAESYGYKVLGLVVRDKAGEICAALPVAYVDSYITGRRWIAFPFSDYCFPLYRSEADLLALLEYVIEFCHEDKLVPLEIRWNLPEHHQIKENSEAVLHLLKLNHDIKKVAAGIHSMHRRNIKQAEARGVRVEMSKSLDSLKLFYSLHLETRRRQGVPVQPWSFFQSLGKKVLENGNGFVLLAYHGDNCLAGAVFLHFNNTVTYKYGASIQDKGNLRPNNLIFWKAIQWGCDNGFDLFDFGKTDYVNAGLRDFKSKWGAEERPLIYSSTLEKSKGPDTGHINNILETIIKRSPLWVCRLIGELLYRHFA